MIKLMCIITNHDEETEDIIKNIFESEKLLFNLVSSCIGTASQSILDYFGLEDVKKKLYVTIYPHNNKELIKKVNNKLKMKNHGNGICFSIPITSGNKYIESMLITNKEIKKMNNENDMNNNYSLIITTVMEGYSDLVMNGAKKGGATGGTIINGRSLGKGSYHFLKMNIEPEKDVILIVCKNELKKSIMEEIVKKAGVKTEAKGMCISIPIEDVSGINH